MNIALFRFLHKHSNIATEGSQSRAYALRLFRMTSRVFYSAQYHRQHFTHVFEQFGALYMHNHDYKYPAGPGLEHGTSKVTSPIDTNEPSGPAVLILTHRIFASNALGVNKGVG